MDTDSFRKARGLLQQAIAHDPGYAPPYTYAALWYIFRVGEIGSPDPDGDATAAADRALAAIERDGSDALALAICHIWRAPALNRLQQAHAQHSVRKVTR